MNSYAYARNDPINQSDSSGLDYSVPLPWGGTRYCSNSDSFSYDPAFDDGSGEWGFQNGPIGNCSDFPGNSEPRGAGFGGSGNTGGGEGGDGQKSTTVAGVTVTGKRLPQSNTCAAALRTAGQTSAAVARANSSMSTLSQAASANGIDPALLAAIGVRETGFQNVAQVGGGGGMGVFQLTNQRGVSAAQAFNLSFSANYAAGMLSSNMASLSSAFPSFTSSQLLQATAASYNFGLTNISGNPNTIDVGTTGGNYGSNVVGLMSCFSY